MGHRIPKTWYAKFAHPAVFLAGLAVLFSPAASAQSDSLSFFKNYFVTGDYAVAGVGLKGTGVNGFATGSITMNSVPANADVIAAYLYWGTEETSATPSAVNGYFRDKPIVGVVVGNSNNAACWSSGGTTGTMKASGRVYRADVLRHLPADKVKNIRIANGTHTVKLPDSGGNGNGNVLYTDGASLVVVYREVTAGQPGLRPLRAVVIYDGAFTLAKDTPTMFQKVAGFYQAQASSAARITHIVANGQPGTSSPLMVGASTLSTTPFIGAQGARWDNKSFPITLGDDASSFTTTVTAGNNQVCLSWSAVVASMIVKDADKDGLLDTWEQKGLSAIPATSTQPASFGNCTTDPGNCVDLQAMGALPNRKDIFAEVDWLSHPGAPGVAAHEHKPNAGAMLMVANAFQSQGIALHLDLGPGAEYASIPNKVPATLSRGGLITDVTEMNLACRDGQFTRCTFPSLNYAVFGWKIGFRGVKEGFPILNVARHFDRNRKDIFRYALFGHALALPDPSNPGIPRSTSGVADLYGADFMVSLGMWRSDFAAYDQIGSPLVQAGTFMHELGHTLGLAHAGIYRAPNCVPNYPSVMNYLYQTRGITSADGSATGIDYSAGGGFALDENLLSEPVSPLNYRIRYYGPLSSSDPPNGAAKRHCDGTALGSGEAPFIRLENERTAFIDWNNNQASSAGPLSLDVNFDGAIGVGTGGTNGAWGEGPGPFGLLTNSSDWASLDLQQIGARMNISGLSSDVGPNDLGQTDFGQTDFGQTDFGQTDFGQTDFGQTDFGQTDFGQTDFGGTDPRTGQTDFGQTDFGDIDYDTHILSTVEVPAGVAATNAIDRITLNWNAPGTGRIQSYNIYRTPTGGSRSIWRNVGGGVSSVTVDDIADAVNTLYNTVYTYEVTAVAGIGSESLESDFSNAVNGIVKRLKVNGNTLQIMYGDPRPSASALYTLSGLEPGIVPTNACSIVTALSDPLPIGTYVIQCSGIDAVGVNSIVYTAGTLEVTRRPVTVAVTASNKDYDRTPDAQIATCTVSGALTGDSIGCTASGTFASFNAGARTVTASNIVLTGARAASYMVTNTPTNTATIRPKPISVTANAATKVYGTADPLPLGYSAPGLISPDVLSGALTRDAGQGVGNPPYMIRQGSLANPNYAVTFVTAGLTITPAPLTVTANSQLKLYQAPDPIFTYTVSGLINNAIVQDTAAVLSGTLSREPGEAVGNYAILRGTLTAGANYTMTFFPANLRIAGFIATTRSMATARSFHTATLLANGKVLVAGGFDAAGTSLASAEVYDPVARTFSPTGNNMPNKAVGHSATLLTVGPNAGRVLVLGGGNSSAQLYNPATNTFTAVGGSGQRSYHTATTLTVGPNAGKVLVVGGSDNSGKTTNAAVLYDPTTGTFTPTGSLTTNREMHTATLLPNGNVLIAGGRSRPGTSYSYPATAEIYNATTGVFSSVAMSAGRYGHTVVLLPNGSVLLAGGATSGAIATADVYSPSTNSFTAVAGSLANPRLNATSFVFAGSAFVNGGQNGTIRYASMDGFTGTNFIGSGSMTAARAGHTLTTFANGSILVTGGQGSAGASIASAETLQ